MNLRNCIREWLGIINLERKLNKINNDLDEFDKDIRRLIDAQKIQSSALGRIIAKVDPFYGTQGDELSKERRAESDRISNAALDRIIAEAKARTAHNQGM